MDGPGTTRRRNIAENFNRLSRVYQRYRRQTDGRTMTYSERVNVSSRSLKSRLTIDRIDSLNTRQSNMFGQENKQQLGDRCLPPPVQRCGTVCLNSFDNRTSPMDNSDDCWKRLCLVNWTAAPSVWMLRASTRNILTYLLTLLTVCTVTKTWNKKMQRRRRWCCLTCLWTNAVFWGGSRSVELSSNHDWRSTVTSPDIIGCSRPHIRHPDDAQRRAAGDLWRVRMKHCHQQRVVRSVVSELCCKVAARIDQRRGGNVGEVSGTWATQDRHFDVGVVRFVALTNL